MELAAILLLTPTRLQTLCSAFRAICAPRLSSVGRGRDPWRQRYTGRQRMPGFIAAADSPGCLRAGASAREGWNK